MNTKRNLIVRLSTQRQGNTTLSWFFKKLCNENCCDQIINEFVQKTNTDYMFITENNLISYINEKNYYHVNLFTFTKYMAFLQNNFNVTYYSLERPNKLKCALSWIIKFDIINKKFIFKKDGTDAKVRILELINYLTNKINEIKALIPADYQFNYDNLYINKELNESYFNNIIEKIGLTRNNTTLSELNTQHISQQVLSYTDYLKYFNEEFLNQLEQETNYSLH